MKKIQRHNKNYLKKLRLKKIVFLQKFLTHTSLLRFNNFIINNHYKKEKRKSSAIFFRKCCSTTARTRGVVSIFGRNRMQTKNLAWRGFLIGISRCSL